MLRMRGRIAAVATAGVLAVAGCGSDAEDPPQSDPPQGAETTPSTAAPGTTAPTKPTKPKTPKTLSFTAETVDGKEFDAATLAGKPVVLWFWAAWCPKCRAAADDVAGVHKDFADRVHVVGVAGLNSGAGAMRDFVADYGIGRFVNLADDGGQVWRRFGVTTQEYYVLLDASGTVVHKGPLGQRELRERVAALTG